MILPSGKRVGSQTPIYSKSNFTWGEATKGCSRKIENFYRYGKVEISALEIEHNIVSTAMNLDQIRIELHNRPIRINSWYRPPAINRRVGGSKLSRHQFGDAVDLVSDYFAPFVIQKMIEKHHQNGGFKAYYSFVHIDWRGYKARW